MEKARYTADQIAKWLLAYNKVLMDSEDSDYFTNLKLQKLLYYAQGCHLAIVGFPLFDDDIVAWAHGPVVESVYYKYRENGSNAIKFNEDYNFSIIDEDTSAILKEVFDAFGQYSAWKLRNMSHDERPWKETAQSNVIDIELIKDFFLKEYIVE